MKILIDSYNTVTQNEYGGVKLKIKDLKNNLIPFADVKLFDKWNDRLTDFDLLHIFMATTESLGVAQLAKKQGLPVVVSAIVNPSNKLKFGLNKFAGSVLHQSNAYATQKRLFDLSDAIICETDNEKKYVTKSFGIAEAKVCVIPNGINDVRTEASAEYFTERTGITGKFILQVGRFDPNKNQLSTIKAVAGTEMQLVFIGGADKSYTEYYEKCKKEAGDNVHFLGWIDHEDILLYSAYAAAHTVILPSHNEIFGSALFDGGIYGCNIVATNVLPLDKWGFAEHCLAVNPSDISDIRAKLKASYNKPKSDMISKIIKRDFTWESVTQQHLEIYKKVLNDKGRNVR